MRLHVRVLGLVVLGLTSGAILAAQQASPYIPLGHWTMPVIEHLIATGVIEDPAPLTRPLRVGDVARALAAADTGRAAPSARAAVRALGAARLVSAAASA